MNINKFYASRIYGLRGDGTGFDTTTCASRSLFDRAAISQLLCLQSQAFSPNFPIISVLK